ncbi:MAG: transposase, partial [Candidatus Cloacimonetes bacterium]|nr:transposase [Candidatus Cloacimonadota bacterium]
IIEIVGNGFKPFQNEPTTKNRNGLKKFHDEPTTNKRNGLKPFPTYGLSEIVRGFKTFSSKYINQKLKYKFTWQKSFYDHIIRNEYELNRISDYIEKNPLLCKQEEYLIELEDI